LHCPARCAASREAGPIIESRETPSEKAALAFASIFALRGNWRVAVPLVWMANTWGFIDLLNGLRGVLQLNVPSFNLGIFWYIYTFYAPLVIVFLFPNLDNWPGNRNTRPLRRVFLYEENFPPSNG
jgi:hypothetical protein